MALADSPSAPVVQALRSVGRKNVSNDAVKQIARAVPKKTKQDLVRLSPAAPDWTRPIVKKIASEYQMNKFAVAPPAERQAAFTETAARMGLNPLIVEKDFWVCRCLRRLFEMPNLPDHNFKGGTSLSKVYKLILAAIFCSSLLQSIDRTDIVRCRYVLDIAPLRFDQRSHC